VYGPRGRIGVIELSTSTSLTAEYAIALPEGVIALFSRIRLPRGEASIEALDEMTSSERIEEAAQELADAEVAVIAFGCTTGSLLHGPGFDEILRERIEQRTGVRATTTATAVVNALRCLDARTVTVGTPYEDELNRREEVFLEGAGFDVVHIEGLGKRDDREIGRLSADAVSALARSAARVAADALFLSCTNLPTLPLIAELEDELGLSIVTSNAATIWETLRLLGVDGTPSRLGRLLRNLGVPASS
jgi:maleate isomerase